MDDLTLRYFDTEMRYLRDAAREFAELHPEEAREMGLTMNGATRRTRTAFTGSC